MAELRATYETMVGEHFKTGAELALQTLGGSEMGRAALETYAFGIAGRVVDPRLETDIASIPLENPVTVGAGWDKKGKAVVGLHALGFAGTEVGTVPMFGQPGQVRPRLWTIDENHSVGLNRMGFNSIGAEGVRRNMLAHGPLPGVVGINAGRNKALNNEHSPEYHAAVVSELQEEGDYFVFNPSTPNTEGLRDNQAAVSVINHVQVMREAALGKPVLVKLSPDMSDAQLAEAVEAAIYGGARGVILTNTTINAGVKARYGTRWANEAGGLSGDDAGFRAMSTRAVRFVYENYGSYIQIVGVGGVKDAATALEKIRAGATSVQVVTAIRSTRGRVAAQINRGLVEFMGREGVSSIKDLVGVDTKRGPLAA